ncbi:MAG TPA: hypothetical protein VGE36_01665 [Roseateles sp.]
MNRLLALVASLLLASTVAAAPYGMHDLRLILTTTDTPQGKKHGLDTAYLERVLADLAAHAQSYPPRFDTPQDKERATQDATTLAGMLGMIVNGPNPHPELLLRAAQVNSMGHNLDIPGAAEKADALFKQLLATAPDHQRGRFVYGVFLASSARAELALPHLEKAAAAGIVDAAYALGMTHLSLGDTAKALTALEDYKRRRPSDTQVDKLIEAIRNGKVQINKR